MIIVLKKVLIFLKIKLTNIEKGKYMDLLLCKKIIIATGIMLGIGCHQQKAMNQQNMAQSSQQTQLNQPNQLSEEAKRDMLLGQISAAVYQKRVVADQGVVGIKEIFEETARSLGIDPFSIRDNAQRTPLHMATIFPAFDIVNYLLSKGAEVNAVDKYGATALDYAKSTSKAADIAKLLLLYKAKSFHQGSKDKFIRALCTQKPQYAQYVELGIPLISAAVCLGDRSVLKTMIKEYNIDPNYACNSQQQVGKYNGYAPLHFAVSVQKYDPEITRMLLASGANSHVKNLASETPLQVASRIGKINAIECLLHESKDDIATRIALVKEASVIAAQNKQMVCFAYLGKKINELEFVARNSKYAPDYLKGYPLLHIAAIQNDFMLAPTILQIKGDECINEPFLMQGKGYSALYFAVIHEKLDMVVFLLSKNARVDLEIISLCAFNQNWSSWKQCYAFLINTFNRQFPKNAIDPIKNQFVDLTSDLQGNSNNQVPQNNNINNINNMNNSSRPTSGNNNNMLISGNNSNNPAAKPLTFIDATPRVTNGQASSSSSKAPQNNNNGRHSNLQIPSISVTPCVDTALPSESNNNMCFSNLPIPDNDNNINKITSTQKNSNNTPTCANRNSGRAFQNNNTGNNNSISNNSRNDCSNVLTLEKKSVPPKKRFGKK